MMQPILASALLQASTNDNELTACTSSGLEGIDEALQGGLSSGCVTSISGEHGTGKTLIALHFLVSHLVSSSGHQAAIIDTTGNFDVLRLYQIIADRLKSKQSADRAAATSNVNPQIFYPQRPTDDLDEAAKHVLDRVKVMRVFDFVGVSEAISELRDAVRAAVQDQQMATAWQAEPTQHRRIADSQADDDDEDIVLFDIAGEDGASHMQKSELVDFLVIDNFTSVVYPIVKADYVQGQVLISTFMRSLSQFCKDANITSLIVNDAATSRQSHVSFPGLTQLNQHAQLPSSSFIQESNSGSSMGGLNQASIFASTTAQPSLGRTFAELVDCHLLLSMLPKRTRDAEILIGGKSGKGEAVHVLEVLKDSSVSGIDRWAAFEIAEGGTRLQKPA